jgi:hypothetical protein
MLAGPEDLSGQLPSHLARLEVDLLNVLDRNRRCLVRMVVRILDVQGGVDEVPDQPRVPLESLVSGESPFRGHIDAVVAVRENRWLPAVGHDDRRAGCQTRYHRLEPPGPRPGTFDVGSVGTSLALLPSMLVSWKNIGSLMNEFPAASLAIVLPSSSRIATCSGH